MERREAAILSIKTATPAQHQRRPSWKVKVWSSGDPYSAHSTGPWLPRAHKSDF